MYRPREYRHGIKAGDLVSYTIREKETDLFIRTCSDLSREARDIVSRQRNVLEGYISKYPFFQASFGPVDIGSDAPPIVNLMAQAARACGVGPMAAVAGAMAQIVGEELSAFSPEVIIENGGDNFIRSSRERIVSIFAGGSILSGKVGLVVPPKLMPVGICTSSAKVGPSISLGKSDATVIAAPSTALADAAATAVGNVVLSGEDIQRGLDFAKTIEGILGAVIIAGDRIGAWGKLEICSIDPAN
jgi:uncharacterized protein